MNADASPGRQRPRLGTAAKVVILILLIGGSAVALLAWRGAFSSTSEVLQGSGIAATRTRAVASFRAIDLAGSNNVRVEVGGAQSVVVHGDDNLLPYVTTRVSAGTLVIGDTRSYAARTGMQVTVTVPSLQRLDLSGSGTVSASHVRSPQLAVSLSGSGTVRADGSAATLSVTLGGSGEVELSGLVARDVRAEIPGSGEIRVTATRALRAAVSGSGQIRYAGHPAHVSRSVTGSGAISSSG